jgi:uncharacterized protein YodC (DUF2158 family)
MRFKPGDRVIKHTGGNKMTVYTSLNEKHECIWVTDKMHQDTFSEDELLTIDEYKTIEERDYKINTLLR